MGSSQGNGRIRERAWSKIRNQHWRQFLLLRCSEYHHWQFKTDFEDIFTADSLNVPWYGTLGNHDYAYDPKPQFSYKSPNNDRWVLPDYYYSKRILLGGSQ